MVGCSDFGQPPFFNEKFKQGLGAFYLGSNIEGGGGFTNFLAKSHRGEWVGTIIFSSYFFVCCSQTKGSYCTGGQHVEIFGEFLNFWNFSTRASIFMPKKQLFSIGNFFKIGKVNVIFV